MFSEPPRVAPLDPCLRPTHLLYLHGFRSSPQSFKARIMADWAQQTSPGLNYLCPQLPPSPREAIAGLLAAVADWPAPTSVVMGSSLGGYYAALISHALGWRAVLINPAVNPARDLARHIGEQTMWHQPEDRFFFRSEFITELQNLGSPRLANPQRNAVLMATGDELLDWREMRDWHHGATQRVIAGSDHALSDFSNHLPFVLEFLQLSKPTQS